MIDNIDNKDLRRLDEILGDGMRWRYVDSAMSHNFIIYKQYLISYLKC